MAYKSLPGPIPEGWRFEISKNKESYFCPGTGQRFFTYEDMMRWVTYAKKAGVPVKVNFTEKEKLEGTCAFLPNYNDFHLFHSSQIAGNLDSEKCHIPEKSSESKKGADIEKTLDLEKGTDAEQSFDSMEGTDTEGTSEGDNLKPQGDRQKNLLAPAADILNPDDLFPSQQGTPDVRPLTLEAETLRHVDPSTVEQISNVPAVPGSPPGEDSPPFSLYMPMIQEFSVGKGGPGRRPRASASKPRRFRKCGR